MVNLKFKIKMAAKNQNGRQNPRWLPKSKKLANLHIVSDADCLTNYTSISANTLDNQTIVYQTFENKMAAKNLKWRSVPNQISVDINMINHAILAIWPCVFSVILRF